MATKPRITSESFIVFTTPADMASDRTRSAVTSHTGRFRRQKRTLRRQLFQQERRRLPTSLAAVPLQKPQDQLLSIPGQGRKDPFASYAISDVPDLVHEVFDHGVQHFWPGLSPGRMPNAVNPVNEAYLEAVRSNPLAFYAYMVGTSENYELLSGTNAKTKSFSQLCLSYRINLIKLINREIQEMIGQPSDDLLGALVVLSANSAAFAGRGECGSLETVKSSRFKSPLRTAQFINVYSAHPFPSAHTEALVRLVIMKGGCSKIRSPGIANAVSLCDLVNASQTNSQLYILLMSPPTLAGLEDLSHLVAEEGNNWVLPATVWNHLPVSRHRRPELLQAVQAMSVVNTALDWYLREDGPAMAFADIVNARNDAQYLLLCLSPSTETARDALFGSEALSEHIYEIGRMSLRIYSNLVLFPMHPGAGTGRILAGALREAIIQSNNASPWRLLSGTCKRMLLWALMLGGIQVDDGVIDAEEERSWFVEQFAAVSSSIGILTWQQVEECLSSFMWLDIVLNAAAVELWVDGWMRTNQDWETLGMEAYALQLRPNTTA